MKYRKGFRNSVLIMATLMLLASCDVSKKSSAENQIAAAAIAGDEPIAEYAVGVFEDSKGQLWFSTIDKGVARYDGKSLTYFTTDDGLVGNTITKILEDKQGNLWLGSHSGLSKYDGKSFTAYKVGDGDATNRVSTMIIDNYGKFWIGTWAGVFQFDGSSFTAFQLPNPDIQVPPYQATANWVSSIMEDKQGNIWIGRSGYGACKYDGTTFTHFTTNDGLPSNCLQSIVQDKQGHIWMGCRVAENDHPDADKRTGNGGLCRYDGKTFTQFPDVKGLHKNDVYSILEDKSGNIWIGANKVGLYRYDGKKFTLFDKTDRSDLLTYGYGFQSIYEDSKGKMWLGLSGGLFRLEDGVIKHVSQGRLRGN